ncbi:UPF0704 protein C6orf165 [Willisornis vidua]|uniref:Cilia- and flagella-associated protein 206 n=1 Tax=Willisornis vidua TaxID=1566151 RepID=A0ABQ9CJY2_9PASS|nr:UPF0704 protein C6orf165 [Willisornis vidua]
MSGELSDSVLKGIIRKVGLDCAAQGQALSETLVAFMVKAVVLDPRNDFNMDQILTEKDMQNLIQLCVTRLLDTTNPSLSTIKMQVYFDMNYANRAELLHEQQRVLEGKLAPMVRGITDSCPRVQEEMEKVYQNIVTYVLLRSGLGSPTDIEAVREVTAALQSVFPQREITTFISLKDKEQQLKNLAMLVTGIRLYNKECGNGGRTIDDLPAILNEAIPSATQTVDEGLNTCRMLAHKYTALLESMQEHPHRYMQLSSFKLKEALFHVRQYEAFLCILLEAEHEPAVCPGGQEGQWHPGLYQEQCGQQNEGSDPSPVLCVGTRVTVSDFKNQEWLFPETTDNFNQLVIQYRSFCAHAIGVKGLTLPGNPAIGILKHKGKCYVFSSKEAAYTFAQDPDKFIQLNVEKAQEYAELIQLLELHHQFEYLLPHAQARIADKCLMKPIAKCDSSTQTDTHILPPTIVRSYEWNEWELRRKAIKLANLRRKLTHSMQTDLSHMKRENFTQVYLPKAVGTQTKRDNSSNVPKPQIFLKGLRGGSSPTTHMVKVDLTRAVDET